MRHQHMSIYQGRRSLLASLNCTRDHLCIFLVDCFSWAAYTGWIICTHFLENLVLFLYSSDSSFDLQQRNINRTAHLKRNQIKTETYFLHLTRKFPLEIIVYHWQNAYSVHSLIELGDTNSTISCVSWMKIWRLTQLAVIQYFDLIDYSSHYHFLFCESDSSSPLQYA